MFRTTHLLIVASRLRFSQGVINLLHEHEQQMTVQMANLMKRKYSVADTFALRCCQIQFHLIAGERLFCCQSSAVIHYSCRITVFPLSDRRTLCLVHMFECVKALRRVKATGQLTDVQKQLELLMPRRTRNKSTLLQLKDKRAVNASLGRLS